ncbi:hypothetical protein AVEN_10086-1 [Araneus ventricosus]|uniref:Uncharacterized protein n=1 Tax=Araneus ventricosus TaxID=182803 RepID=A0A4Y2M6U0_ARAVE|nr:hypothetical protein AVEN_10086-1 [Araneus ventricosus]
MPETWCMPELLFTTPFDFQLRRLKGPVFRGVLQPSDEQVVASPSHGNEEKLPRRRLPQRPSLRGRGLRRSVLSEQRREIRPTGHHVVVGHCHGDEEEVLQDGSVR